MALFQKKQQIVICIVAVLLVGDFILFGCLSLWKTIRSIEQTRAAQTVAITKALAESRQLPELKEQLREPQGTVENYEANVPGHRDLGVFLHRIANLMNECNLREQLVQPGKEVAAEGLNCIPVSMQCKGRLKQIFVFFSSLQALDRLVRIEQIKLKNDSDFSGEVSVQTRAFVYYGTEARTGQI